MNGMIETIIIFLATVIAIALPYGLATMISTYPGKFWIKRMYQNPILYDDIFFLYYQRATGYRMLFMVHTFFKNIIKILGTAALFITVYYAVVSETNKHELVLLFSLITAMCQVTELLIPMDKFILIYTNAARIMEYVLFEVSAGVKNGYIDKKTAYEKLREAYTEAEEYIRKEYI